MIDLGRLRALHAVAQYGSVNRAAEVLGYTPSAVSQQLAKLERETRTTLVERQGRGIVLTDAARELAATASRILELVEDAELTLEEQRGQAIGTLSIAAFPTAARGLLPPALARLIDDNPGLDVRVVETDPVRGRCRGQPWRDPRRSRPRLAQRAARPAGGLVAREARIGSR